MSLIQTLINKGYHAYQQLREQQSPVQPAAPDPAGPVESGDADTPVSLSHFNAGPAASPRPKPEQAIRTWQREIGQAIASLQTVLRQKVAEYQLPEGTDLNVRPEGGQIIVDAAVPEPVRKMIEADLNNMPQFRATLQTVWQSKPALDIMQNVVRLQQAYGTENRIYSSVLSQHQEFNGLTDLATRFQRLQRELSGQAA